MDDRPVFRQRLCSITVLTEEKKSYADLPILNLSSV